MLANKTSGLLTLLALEGAMFTALELKEDQKKYNALPKL